MIAHVYNADGPGYLRGHQAFRFDVRRLAPEPAAALQGFGVRLGKFQQQPIDVPIFLARIDPQAIQMSLEHDPAVFQNNAALAGQHRLDMEDELANHLIVLECSQDALAGGEPAADVSPQQFRLARSTD